MKAITHYFQSPAASKKTDSVANGTTEKKKENSFDESSTESPPPILNKPSKDSASKKRKALSLKRATENGESKGKKSSKENSSKNDEKSDNDSSRPTKKSSSSKRSLSSSKRKSEDVSKKMNNGEVTSEPKPLEPEHPCSDKEVNKISIENKRSSSNKAVKNHANINGNIQIADEQMEAGLKQEKVESNVTSDVEMIDLIDSNTVEDSQNLSEVSPANGESASNVAEATSKHAGDNDKKMAVKEGVTDVSTSKKESQDSKSTLSKDLVNGACVEEVFVEEGSEEEGKILKKRKLETKESTPNNVPEVSSSKPNAFQFMMSSSSKKTAHETKKKESLVVLDVKQKDRENSRNAKSSIKETESSDKTTKDTSPTNKTPSSRKGRKRQEKDKQIESPEVFKDEKKKHKKESEKKSKNIKEEKKEKNAKQLSEKAVQRETSNKTKELIKDTVKTEKSKKSDSFSTEKSPDAFKFLMSSKKQPKPTENIIEEDEIKKSKSTRGKRKNIIVSDDSDEHDTEESPKPQVESASKPKPSGLFGYFSPVSRDEARKRATEILVTKTVTAEVHQLPSGDSPEENKRHSMGPKRRSQRSSKQNDEEEIIVVSVEDASEETAPKPVKKPFKFKTPEKKRRRPWQLKVRLISPAKPMEDPNDSSESNCTDSDSDCTDITESPLKKQSDLKSLWAARGKEMRLAPIFASKSKNASKQPNVVDSKGERKIKPSVSMPLMRPAPTEHTIGFVEVDPTTPISVLYPSINHVTQTENSSTRPKAELTFPPTPVKEIPSCPVITLGSLISISQPNEELSTSSQKNLSKKIVVDDNGESWCDKHRPSLVADLAGNVKSVDRLKAWLEGWRQRSITFDETSHKSSDSESSDYSSEDDFIVSDDESSREGRKKKKKKKHCNTALLVGPCGSGKTAAVFAAAEELGYKVLEMNASSKRSGKRILSELQEATQSHQVRNNAVDQETLNSFFGSTKGKDKNKDQVTESQQQASNNSGLSLILVEDVDVVFEEQDEGFLAALNVLAASSKRPLILVSNEPQCPLLLARQHRLHLEFKKVPAATTGEVLKRICSKEGENIVDSQMQHLMKVCNGDLRRAVLLAQTWTLTGGFPQLPPSHMLPFPLNLSELWTAMKHKPLPFILTEDEVAEEEVEEPKPTENSDDDNIFSPIKKKKPKVRRQRLTSDSLDNWEPCQQATSCHDLKKMQWFSDTLAALDIMQGGDFAELNFSYLRPGLSDQPCYKAVPDHVGPLLQHWLASKAVVASGCTLSFQTSEERDKWKEAHREVDQALLEQLPVTGQLDHCAAALDLLPTLRELGRSEQSSARVSRRSRINALNSLGFHPGGIVIETLPFIFPDTESI